MIRQTLRPAATAASLFLACCASLAGPLAGGTLIAPLDPGQNARLSFTMPTGFAADQEVWVVYELVALSPGDDSGEVEIEQAFENVKTPLKALYVTFRADDMESRPENVRGLIGAEMYATYESVNAGGGRVLGGHVVSHLSASGKSDTPLLVSVERAQGMQPLALRVTVGQGQLPLEFQQKPQDTLAYKVGFFGGLALFGWLLLRLFRRLFGRRSQS